MKKSSRSLIVIISAVLILAGYETANGLFSQLNTQFSMVNISPENKWFTNDASVIRNTGFGFSAGYRF